jgi:hypothetical protein
MGKPMPLLSNKGKSFQGSIVLGKGFILSVDEAKKLIIKDPRNKDVLFPYLNGDDLNNDPEQKNSRWVINFFDWDEEKAKTYPDCYKILEKLVKPDRQRWKIDSDGNEIVGTYLLRNIRAIRWWQYAEKAMGLYRAISELDQVMVLNRHAKHLLISICKNNIIFSEATVVFALNTFSEYAILNSSIHDVWAWKNSSTMGASTLRYSASRAFETFPFPEKSSDLLEDLGLNLYTIRKKLMLKYELGLTDLQNIYHNKDLTPMSPYYDDIKMLRQLQKEIDYLVVEAYHWENMKLQHDFYTMEYLPENDRIRFSIHLNIRREILKLLSLLNHRLHKEEISKCSNTGTQAKKVTKKYTKDDSLKLF